MRVLVTGASGFIGSHVVVALKAAGHEPVGYVRDEIKLNRAMAMHGITDLAWSVGDINDAAAITEAINSCDAMVHTVGIASVRNVDEDQMRRVNTDGTRTVLSAAVDAGLDPIIHVSSVAALFPAPGPEMTSDDPLGTSDSAYGRTKAAAERIARQAQTDDHPVTIFYPGGVYGPIDPGQSDLIEGTLTMFDKGAFLLPTGGGNSFIDVRDLAAAIAAAVVPGQGPRRFMAGGHYVPWAEWVAPFQEVTGRKIRILEVPAAALKGLGAGLDFAARAVKAFDPPIGRESAIFMSDAKPTDDRRTQSELGVTWRPLRESVADFVGWLTDSGRLILPGSVSADSDEARELSGADRFAAKLAMSDRFRSWGPKYLPDMHRRMARLTNGKFVPGAALVLTSTGAKSGQRRETPLETVPRGDGSFLVVGSNWAQEHHPAWTWNVIKDPQIEILVKGKSMAATATLLTGDERAEAWAEALDHWPVWTEYTTITDREFRIFHIVPKA